MTTFSQILRSKRGEEMIGKAIQKKREVQRNVIKASEEKDRRYNKMIRKKDRLFRRL